MLLLFAVHGAEIWLYAGLYLALDAIGTLRDAVYYSTVAYAAIGFSDDAIDPGWALVGAIEGINGIVLIGWTTAFLITLVSRFDRR